MTVKWKTPGWTYGWKWSTFSDVDWDGIKVVFTLLEKSTKMEMSEWGREVSDWLIEVSIKFKVSKGWWKEIQELVVFAIKFKVRRDDGRKSKSWLYLSSSIRWVRDDGRESKCWLNLDLAPQNMRLVRVKEGCPLCCWTLLKEWGEGGSPQCP
jgi:hypothetical protein